MDGEKPADRHHWNRGNLHGSGYFRRIGPGLITGAADDDPSGIGTYSQVGAASGFGLLWTAVFALPLATAVQESTARLGLVTGKGLAALIKMRYPRWVLLMAVSIVAASIATCASGRCLPVSTLASLTGRASGT